MSAFSLSFLACMLPMSALGAYWVLSFQLVMSIKREILYSQLVHFLGFNYLIAFPFTGGVHKTMEMLNMNFQNDCLVL